MKVFPHGKRGKAGKGGQGDGLSPIHYLTRTDYAGRDTKPPQVVRGDPAITSQLIDSLNTQWRFTAGVLSWHPEDVVTPEQEQRVMDDFERTTFASLPPDAFNILWVRHLHAEHHELHFVIPRVELHNGKAFNPCPPGWQKHFDVFRDMYNHQEQWARPDDPSRARFCTPEHADIHRARLKRWGKDSGKDARSKAKEALHDYIRSKIEQGLVHNRQDIVQELQEIGLVINRSGKDYITVKDPQSGEKLRLKGGIYAELWQCNGQQYLRAGDPCRTHPRQDGTGQARDREPDPATVHQFAAELERIIATRAQYNRSRYPQPACDLAAGHCLAVPNVESDREPEFWQEMSASPVYDGLSSWVRP